jgi:hypothetical protein
MFESRTGHGGAPMEGGVPPMLVWASWPLPCDPKLQIPLFGEKLSWYFSSILFPAKTDIKKTFAKNNVRFSSFI